MMSFDAHLIDISGVFFRYYFSPSRDVINEDGWDVTALLGTTKWLMSQDFSAANYIFIAFDESLGTGYRHQIDENYKANRPLPTQDIIYQFECLKTIVGLLGMQAQGSEIYEADDLIAMAVEQCSGLSVKIHSRDKDLRQLINKNTLLEDFVSGKRWDEASLELDESLTPMQIPLYLAMVGDSSDNIVGIPRIGEKTAKTLLSHYDSWEQLLEAVRDEQRLPVRGSEGVAKNILAFSDLIPHNLSLTLLQRAPLAFQLTAKQSADLVQLDAFLDEIGLLKPLLKYIERISP